MRVLAIGFWLIAIFHISSATAKKVSTLTVTCSNFQGYVVQLKQDQEPVEKIGKDAFEGMSMILSVNLNTGKGTFKVKASEDNSDPLEGTLKVADPFSPNKLMLLNGNITMLGIPVLIGLYRQPDKIVFSQILSISEQFENPAALSEAWFLQADTMHGDCVYK